MSLRRTLRRLVPAAVLAAVLGPVAVFFLGPASFESLAAGPYLRSLALASLTAFGALLLGLPAGWALAGAELSSRWLRAGALAVLLVPPYLAASAWLGIAGRLDLLAIDKVLALVPGSGFLAGGNLLTAAWVLSLALWPCVALPAAAALASVGREGREAALLSRGPKGCLWGLELPAALPAALVGALVAFALGWAELGAADLFLVTTAAQDVLKGFESSHDYSAAAGRALPLVAGGLLLAAGLMVIASRPRFAELARARLAPMPASARARAYAYGLLALSLGGVLAGLLLNSGSFELVARKALEQAPMVLRSLLVALASAVLAVALGAALVWALSTSRGGTGLMLVLGALSITLLLPGTLWGLGVLKVRGALGAMDSSRPAGVLFLGEMGFRLLDSPLVLFWAGAARAALGTAAVLAWGRRSLKGEMLGAARTAGAGWLDRLWLAAGLLRAHIAAALLLGLALALGELGATLMIYPPGWDTLSVWVFNQMHYSHGHTTAALALVTTAAAALFGALTVLVSARRAHTC